MASSYKNRKASLPYQWEWSEKCNGQHFLCVFCCCYFFVCFFCLLDVLVLTLGCLRAPLLKYDFFRITILYMIREDDAFVEANTCYRLTGVAVILVNSELSLLNVFFQSYPRETKV